MKRWRFHEDVPDEIEQAARWYEKDRPGLGGEFLIVLDEVLGCLEAGSIASGPCPDDRRARRVLMPRFPYAVVFVETDEETVVVAIVHLKRRPGYWTSRL